jgi:hypothetical protein
MRRVLIGLIVLSAAAFAADTIEAFGLKWKAPIAADWKLETLDGIPTVSLLVPRPSTEPRRPTQFLVAETPDYIRVTLEAEMRQEPAAQRNRHTSLMIAYAWRDADHFNYAHMSVDAAAVANVHNGIFQVDSGDRVRLSSLEGPGSLAHEGWHKVKLTYDGRTGKVQVWVDGKTSPSLTVVNGKFSAGKVGIGSFFDLGQFRNVKITGEAAR